MSGGGKEEIARMFGVLRIAPPPFRRDVYTLEQLVGELVETSRYLRLDLFSNMNSVRGLKNLVLMAV